MPLVHLWEVLGGLGLFILGMKAMSDGLQRFAGGRLRRFVEKATGTRLTAAIIGSGLASILQSSSAASILVIGCVNAGLISVYQALAVLLGTGLGSTLAVQFIAFHVSAIALPAIFAGSLLTFFSKNRRLVYLGNLLLGAGLIFLGLQIMETGFLPISRIGFVTALQSHFISWKISAALFGGLLTFVIQSGSAATGIFIAMVGSGLVGYETGVAMVAGEVLGTALVTMTATVNGTPAAKRTALLFLAINGAAVAILLLLFPFFLKLVAILSPGNISMLHPEHESRLLIFRHLANAHTIFNLAIAILFLPFAGFLVRNAPSLRRNRRQNDMEPRPRFIDMRVLNTPTLAILQAKSELNRMSDISRLLYNEVVGQFYRYDARRSSGILQKHQVLQILEHELSAFLIQLSRRPGVLRNVSGIPLMLHMVRNLKQLGDRSQELLELLRRKKEERILFSGTAMSDLKSLATKVGQLVNRSSRTVGEETEGDLGMGRSEMDEINGMIDTMLNSHMVRLTAGKCSVAAGMVYTDILTCFGKTAELALDIMELEGELTDAVTSGSD